MAPLFVLATCFVLFRGLGRLGVRGLTSWRAAGRAASAAMFLFTGATHFSPMKSDYLAMTPPPLRERPWLISLTGALQVAGAVGLLLPATRRLAGRCLALLLVAMFPANAYAAVKGIPFRGRPPTPLWLRAPAQAVYIAVVWWSSVVDPAPRRDRR